MLNQDVALIYLVEGGREVAVNGTRVDTLIDPQHRHSDLGHVIRRQSPKTAMRIPVFRTNPWVQDKGAMGWDLEDASSKNVLTKSENKCRLSVLDELLCSL